MPAKRILVATMMCILTPTVMADQGGWPEGLDGWAYVGKHKSSGACRFIGVDAIGPDVRLQVLRTNLAQEQETLLDALSRQHQASKDVERALKERGVGFSAPPIFGEWRPNSWGAILPPEKVSIPLYPYISFLHGMTIHGFVNDGLFGDMVVMISEGDGVSFSFVVEGTPKRGTLRESSDVKSSMLSALKNLDALADCGN